MKLWYYFNNFLPEPGILTRFYSEMVKVKNSTKNVFNWRVNISWTTSSKTYKFWRILWREINNSLLEFGILTTFGSKMVSVRKSIKNDFNWRVNISQTATVKTSKFWAIICVEFVHDLRTEVQKKCPNFSTLKMSALDLIHSVWKVSKYGVNSGPYFPVFGLSCIRIFSLKVLDLRKYTSHLIAVLRKICQSTQGQTDGGQSIKDFFSKCDQIRRFIYWINP